MVVILIKANGTLYMGTKRPSKLLESTRKTGLLKEEDYAMLSYVLYSYRYKESQNIREPKEVKELVIFIFEDNKEFSILSKFKGGGSDHLLRKDKLPYGIVERLKDLGIYNKIRPTWR